jgi:AraC-like DNA-binding protein
MQVSMMMVRALSAAVERDGKRERFLELSGLSADALDDGSSRVPLTVYLRVLDAALTASGNPALGLRMGEHASPLMFDVIGHVAEHADTLRQGLEAVSRYAKIAADAFGPQLFEDGESAAVRLPMLSGNHPATRLTAEFALVALFGWIGTVVDEPSAGSVQVRFAYEPPEYREEYQRIFGDAFAFDCEFTELVFPRKWLDTPHRYRNADLHEVLVTQADRVLHRIDRERALSDRVVRVLAQYEPREMPSMVDVASALEMSARSLRRKLTAEGFRYGDLVEKALAEKAKRLLEAPGASIQETAYAMGFATAAAFHRAFKRWTGLTPKQHQDSF